MHEHDETITHSNILEQIENLDWKTLWPKLLAHTISTLLHRYGIKKELPELAQEFVQEVLSGIINKKPGDRNGRTWNTAVYPDFYDFVTSAIDSHINNHFSKSKSKEQSEEDPTSFYLNDISTLSHEELLMLKEVRDQFEKELENFGADYDELLVFGCMAEGLYEPRFIADDLGIDISECYKILRKLRSRINKVRIKLNL